MSSTPMPTLDRPASRPRLAARQAPLHDGQVDDSAVHVLDHGRAVINGLLAGYAHLQRSGSASQDSCHDLVQRLCVELAAYMHVQEELLYPRLREQLANGEPIDRSEIEHECLRDLMARLMDSPTDGPLFNARITVLAELFNTLAQRERLQLLPLLQSVDSRALGRQVAERRAALLAELAERPHSLRIENEEADPVGEPPR